MKNYRKRLVYLIPVIPYGNRFSPRADGFTLPELLIAAIIAALLTAATAQVMIGQLLEGRRLEAAQRVRENFSRLNYLVQIEASEAERMEVGGTAPGCGSQGFTLWIPRPDQTYGPTGNRSGVQYFVANGEIWRCGPRVFQNGTLSHPSATVESDGSVTVGTDGIVSGPVVRNATFALVNPPPSGQEVKQLTYQVDFTGGNFGIAGATEPVTLHAKSIFACNPANPLTPDEIGDCP